jgi:hypothetical protein
MSRYFALAALTLGVSYGSSAQDKPDFDQISRATGICEEKFMVGCTPGGDRYKERCFTVPACYKVVQRFYGDLLEEMKRQDEPDREFVEDTAKKLP